VFDFHTSFRLCGIFAVLAWACFRFSKAWRFEDDLFSEAGEAE